MELGAKLRGGGGGQGKGGGPVRKEKKKETNWILGHFLPIPLLNPHGLTQGAPRGRGWRTPTSSAVLEKDGVSRLPGHEGRRAVGGRGVSVLSRGEARRRREAGEMAAWREAQRGRGPGRLTGETCLNRLRELP